MTNTSDTIEWDEGRAQHWSAPGNVGCHRSDKFCGNHIFQLHEFAHHVFEQLREEIKRVVVHLNLCLACGTKGVQREAYEHVQA
jgi:hypothetical protein